MSYLCPKPSCTNRFTIGTEFDEDVINYVCPNCERLLPVSDNRTAEWVKRTKRVGIISLVVLLVGFIGYWARPFASFSDTFDKDSPEATLRYYLEKINQGDHESAYRLTRHKGWKELTSFKKVATGWNSINSIKIGPISYFSFHGADTILRASYEMKISAKADPKMVEFDYHLRKDPDGWKIVRYVFPQDVNESAIKKEEMPSNAQECVSGFVEYLKKEKYKKAYLLLDTSIYHSQKHFLESTWTNYRFIDVEKVDFRNKSDYEFTNVSLSFSAGGTDFEGKDRFFYNFYVADTAGYWQIIKIKEERAQMAI